MKADEIPLCVGPYSVKLCPEDHQKAVVTTLKMGKTPVVIPLTTEQSLAIGRLFFCAVWKGDLTSSAESIMQVELNSNGEKSIRWPKY